MEEGTQLIIGRQPVAEALRAGRPLHKLLIAEGVREQLLRGLITQAQERGIPIHRVGRSELDRITRGAVHQGVVAEAASFRYAHVEDIIQRARQAGTPLLAVVADGIQDPQNLGTLIRSAEAAGAHGVIIRERRAAGVTPAVIKASAGAVEYLPIARVVNLVRTLDDLKRAGAWVYALETEPSAPTYNTVDLTVPVAIVVGSEGRGVGRLVKQVCDGILRIPLRGHVGSLNAAVAASIVLYEVVRQRSS